MEISYNGSNYHGWQIQPNAITVQQVMERSLSLILREETRVTGCGRTDTGVHASSFFLHFDSDADFLLSDIKFKLNNFLPKDIAVKDCFPVKENAHARFDAISRTYKYFIHQQKDPFLKGISLYMPFDLNIDEMQKAAAYLFNYKDFSSFCKLHADNKTNDCKITEAKWEKTEKSLLFKISADRFLRNMVRAIVGTMLNIGKERYPAHYIKEIIEKKDRSEAGQSASAHGLFLTNVEYPEKIKI